MAKNLLYKIFGLRKVPRELRRRFEGEGIVIDEEGTSCALSYKKFRGPRNASLRGWESAHAGSLIITEKTFYVQFPYLLVCYKPIGFAASRLELQLKNSNVLVMKFVVEELFDNASGGLTCHWRTDNAPKIYDYLLAAKNSEAAI